MGVKDLGAFIKARSPSSVTTYTSLAPFRGKRLAIDANLLTTKFHHAEAGRFAPGAPLEGVNPIKDDPAAGRSHARAWYWFLEALRKYGIQPIVVFDGDTRLAAKALENERRRDARALQGARAVAEGGRGARLREIEAVFSAIRDEDRPAVVEGFRSVVERMLSGEAEPAPPVAATLGETSSASTAAATAALEHRASLVQIEKLLEPQSEAERALPVSKSMPPDLDLKPGPLEPAALPPALAPPTAEVPAAEADQKHPAFDDRATAEPESAVADPSSTPSSTTLSPSLAAALAASRLARTHKLTSLVGPAASHGPIVAHVVALATLFVDYRADAVNPVYSRNQARVTEDEGRFFEGLLRGGTPAEAAAAAADAASEGERVLGEEEPPAPPAKELPEIIAQSDKYRASHKKRSEGVPRAAFQEVRRLVAALGVPFLEPSPLDPHEAEGVCAALCALGHADYVVSEDTDVVVYGAPLLRSVTVTPAGTGREAVKSMNVLDPVRVREDLGLTDDEFVDFALLCGTDFTERVYKVGPASAYRLIVAHSSIERALAAHDAGLKPALVLPEALDREVFLERIRVARAIFSSVPQLPLPPSPSPTAHDASSTAPPSSSSPSATSPSTFVGSLTPSPPSPTLAALLRSYGIRRSRHFSPRYTASPSSSPASAPSPALLDDLGLDDGAQEQEFELDELRPPRAARAHSGSGSTSGRARRTCSTLRCATTVTMTGSGRSGTAEKERARASRRRRKGEDLEEGPPRR
ncbi:hypothetical protein JCM9279_004403 [Rhodotorula babjevae]